MNFDQPQPSSAYPSSELVVRMLIDLPTNKDFNELIKRKSEKMVSRKGDSGRSSTNPVPMTCVLVLANDESARLKIKSDILWRNDGVLIIAADFGGNAFVRTLSWGRIGADYIVGDMDASWR